MSSPNPSEVLSLAAEIVKAEEVLSSLKSKWDAIFGASPMEKRSGGRPMRVDSVPSRIVAHLDASPDQHFNADELARALGVEKVQVERALPKLTASKRISRHSRGNYEAIAS